MTTAAKAGQMLLAGAVFAGLSQQAAPFGLRDLAVVVHGDEIQAEIRVRMGAYRYVVMVESEDEVDAETTNE